MLLYDCYESPIGTLYLTGEDGVLTGISFLSASVQHARAVGGEVFAPVKSWLDAYFMGKQEKIKFSLNPSGTAFQQLIWQMLLRIPYGETRTYGDLAKEAAQIMGREKMSAQAVGQAVGSNPIAIIIPCHRCVGAGGKLTGYAHGIDKKRALLQHEQIQEVE